MIITFFFNFLNHHQVLVADEMYKLIGDNFRFVATYPRNPDELKGGKDYSDRPYCILAGESAEANTRAHEFNKVSDVCVYGAGHLEWMRERAKTDKLSFEVSERWLKRGWINVLSPRLLKWWRLYQTTLKDKPFYKLCASAFAAHDDELLGCYKGKHYKWGYFTKVDGLGFRVYGESKADILQSPSDFYFSDDGRKTASTSSGQAPVEASTDVSTSEITPLMWCSRFLMLKHPELPILMADRLKKKGFKFHLDMYGEGEYKQQAIDLVESLGLSDCVSFIGNKPNTELMEDMKQHEIFLFTSDKNEGWGAVANESMSNGCVLVGSDALGCAPYLIKDGENGFMFKSSKVSCSFGKPDKIALDSLYDKVVWLLEHPMERKQMQQNAVKQMQEVWSPQNAAQSLLRLIEDIKNGRETSMEEGPCSKA